jgi:hypothetical protein
MPTRGSFVAYRIAPAAMMGMTAAAIYAFIRAVAARVEARTESLALALAFASLYFSQMPSVAEGIYWYAAGTTYQVPVALAFVHLALVIRYRRALQPTLRDRSALASAVGLLILITGFNEVVLTMLVALYSAWTLFTLRRGRSSWLLPFGLLLVTGACAQAVVWSPGNAVRRSMYVGVHHQIATSLGMTVLQTVRFGATWATNGPLLLATLLFLPVAAKWTGGQLADSRWSRPYFLMAAVGLLLVIPMAVFPVYWETGILGQRRTINVAYCVFLVLWFTAAAMWLASGSTRAYIAQAFAESARLPLTILLVASLALTGNSYIVGADLVSKRLANFDRQMHARYDALQACAVHGDAVCTIDPIDDPPGSFVMIDGSSDPNDWVNRAHARFFNLPEVVIRPPRDDVRH